MTTTFFLVRHAAHDRVGTVLCGRMSGVTLGSEGREQAQSLARYFSGNKIASIHTSPLERAIETAQPIAVRLEKKLHHCDEIGEIDFGLWTGKAFSDLSDDPNWAVWNNARSVTRPPQGETMLEAQARIVSAMDRLRKIHPDQSVILVSHSDVIKAALLYHLGMPIDAYARFEISPASVSTLLVGDWGAKVLRLNEMVAP